MRTALQPFADTLCRIIIKLTVDAEYLLHQHRDDIDAKYLNSLREIRTRGINSFAVICNIFQDQHQFEKLLCQENLQHTSGLINLFMSWSNNRYQCLWLTKYNNKLLDH
eukprot:Pgem_evm1s7342